MVWLGIFGCRAWEDLKLWPDISGSKNMVKTMGKASIYQTDYSFFLIFPAIYWVWSESWPFNSWWRHNILYWMDLVVFHRDVGLPEGSKRVVTPNSQLMASWMVGCAIIEVYYFRAFCFQIWRTDMHFLRIYIDDQTRSASEVAKPFAPVPRKTFMVYNPPNFIRLAWNLKSGVWKGFSYQKGFHLTFMFYVFL